jgi:hypothetical protein
MFDGVGPYPSYGSFGEWILDGIEKAILKCKVQHASRGDFGSNDVLNLEMAKMTDVYLKANLDRKMPHYNDYIDSMCCIHQLTVKSRGIGGQILWTRPIESLLENTNKMRERLYAASINPNVIHGIQFAPM